MKRPDPDQGINTLKPDTDLGFPVVYEQNQTKIMANGKNKMKLL